MSDEELTALAAKAFGNAQHGFSPLTDDGDALRLAVELHIGIRSNSPDHWQNADETVAIWDDHEGVPRQLRQEHDGDPRAATRLAITRAAAAIGEQMP